jgi:hypothetical protein
MRPFHAMLCVLLAAGCTSAPLPPDTASPLFGGGIAVAPVQVAAAGPFDGLYAGTAMIDVNPNLACYRELPIGGFRVDGGRVRFGGFRGRIGPDGAATLQYGQSTMAVRLGDGGGQGMITLYPNLMNYEEFCVYRASLKRVAA